MTQRSVWVLDLDSSLFVYCGEKADPNQNELDQEWLRQGENSGNVMSSTQSFARCSLQSKMSGPMVLLQLYRAIPVLWPTMPMATIPIATVLAVDTLLVGTSPANSMSYPPRSTASDVVTSLTVFCRQQRWNLSAHKCVETQHIVS